MGKNPDDSQNDQIKEKKKTPEIKGKRRSETEDQTSKFDFNPLEIVRGIASFITETAKIIKDTDDTLEEVFRKVDPLDVFLDPVKSKILFQVILYGETTAEALEGYLQKSRSTISHHLKKLVDNHILQVRIGTGKIKYYSFNQEKHLSYKLDLEDILSSSLEKSSKSIIRYLQTIAINNGIFSSIIAESCKQLRKHQPFDKIRKDSNDNLILEIKDSEIIVPTLRLLAVNEEQAQFLVRHFDEVLKEAYEKFKELFSEIGNIDQSKPKYLLNFTLFPYLSL
ncbi:MAG: winged helix-turn-helix domain-containing protein [Candidatus Hodarchaeota archaeon]